MTYDANTVMTSMGETLVHQYKSNTTDSLDNRFNVVYYRLENPYGELSDSTFTAMVDEVISGITDRADAELKYVDDQSTSRLNSAVFRVAFGEQLVSKGRILSDGFSVAVAQCYMAKARSLNRNIDKFLNSVKLTEAEIGGK